jgi:hypothetical protein
MNAKTHSAEIADLADLADLAELADRYVALWNETDAGARRAAIATLWVPEGEHFVRTLQVKGYEKTCATAVSVSVPRATPNCFRTP